MTSPVLTSALGLGLASLLGSGLGLIIKKIPHRWNDIFLGFCAGMMLAASLVCLIMPAVEMITPQYWWQIILGVAAGVALIGFLDYVTPHLHRLTGLEYEQHHNTSTNRVLLFVLAIALHKFPEGLATGITFNGQDLANAYSIAIVIALQNIPEGMVVVTPLVMIGIRYSRVVLVAVAVALLEVIGVYIGFLLGEISETLLPVMLSLAGGAMLYVISDEMIPETHSHGYEKYATYALVAGVLSMLFINQLT